MTDFPKVAIVILNWNGINLLKKFLPSVCATTYPNMDIVVGDNASNDGSVQFLKEHYPEIKIVLNKQNYGFAGGYNRVLNRIDCEYFVLLNSDVEVDADWIGPVIQLMETDQNIAVAQPKILSFNNKHLFEYAGAAGGYMDSLGYPFCRGRIFDTLEVDQGQYNTATEIFWASGAALFIKKEKWNEMGGLDEGFFAHMEEIDLCWRLKNKGYKIMYCPESTIYHVGGGTLDAESPYKTYLNFRNNLVMLQKNLPFIRSVAVIFVRFWLDLLSLIKFFIEGKPRNAIAISKAHFFFFKNIFKNSRKSKELNKENFNKAGLFNGSIVWEYFIRRKKTFKSL